MKFKDKKYLSIKGYDEELREITFYPFEIGFGTEYDDIELYLKICDDNSIILDFTDETSDMLDVKGSIYSTPMSISEKEYMLKMFKKELINNTFIGDEYELVFE
jgi:hypothetical protein